MRGMEAEIVEITLDDDVPDSMDVYTLGGAGTSPNAWPPSPHRAPGHAARRSGRASGTGDLRGHQVLGHWYETAAGEKVDGIGLFDLTTSPGPARSIGELVTEPLLAGP